jgi:hypothetical protein
MTNSWGEVPKERRHLVSRLSLSRRQSATTVGASTDQARVCLDAPPLASAMLLLVGAGWLLNAARSVQPQLITDGRDLRPPNRSTS